MKHQQLKIKLIPYKIVFGISSSLFGISTIITWMLYSISEVDFNFFLEHYGIYSIIIFIASILSLVFLAFIPLNKVMKIIEKHEEQSAID
jgi:Na+/H+ antiporter NhaD/arsenite permease-like protein